MACLAHDDWASDEEEFQEQLRERIYPIGKYDQHHRRAATVDAADRTAESRAGRPVLKPEKGTPQVEAAYGSTPVVPAPVRAPVQALPPAVAEREEHAPIPVPVPEEDDRIDDHELLGGMV